jgi:hypothetical protein
LVYFSNKIGNWLIIFNNKNIHTIPADLLYYSYY